MRSHILCLSICFSSASCKAPSSTLGYGPGPFSWLTDPGSLGPGDVIIIDLRGSAVLRASLIILWAGASTWFRKAGLYGLGGLAHWPEVPPRWK